MSDGTICGEVLEAQENEQNMAYIAMQDRLSPKS